MYDDGYKVYMVMEMMKGGELLDRILQQTYFSEREAASIVYVLVSRVLPLISHVTVTWYHRQPRSTTCTNKEWCTGI